MRSTGTNYDPFPRTREVDCRITFGVIAAKTADADITANEPAFLGSPAQTADGNDTMSGKWASLEPDFWRLDGTYDLIPDDTDGLQVGWWSQAVSGADGRFENPPFVQYMFTDETASIGWTLSFDGKSGQYPVCTQVDILAADGTVRESLIYTKKTPVQEYRYPGGVEYYGVRFTFLETSEPCRRIRLTECVIGVIRHYDRDTLGRVQILYGAEPDGSALPSRELVFTFDNSGGDFNLLDPDELYRHLREGHTLSADIIIGGEPVYMGEFYFNHADTSNSVIAPEITAYDRVYSLESYTFDGGRDEETTLSAAVAEVLGVTGYDIPLYFGGGIADRRVHMSVRVNTPVRKALQQLAQAARCTAYIDRDGVLRFVELTVKPSPDAELTADALYDFSGVSVSERVHGIRLTVSDEFRIGKDGTPGRQVYFYSGDENRAVGYSNPCIADSEGQAVADWLLSAANSARKYKVQNRCDPAVEIGDTIRIADAYGNDGTAVVTGIDVRFGASLYARTEAVG